MASSKSSDTASSKLVANITTTIKLTDYLKYNFVFGVEASNSARKRQVLPTINIRSTALRAIDDVNGGVEKFGYANIANLNKFIGIGV